MHACPCSVFFGCLFFHSNIGSALGTGKLYGYCAWGGKSLHLPTFVNGTVQVNATFLSLRHKFHRAGMGSGTDTLIAAIKNYFLTLGHIR